MTAATDPHGAARHYPAAAAPCGHPLCTILWAVTALTQAVGLLSERIEDLTMTEASLASTINAISGQLTAAVQDISDEIGKLEESGGTVSPALQQAVTQLQGVANQVSAIAPGTSSTTSPGTSSTTSPPTSGTGAPPTSGAASGPTVSGQ